MEDYTPSATLTTRASSPRSKFASEGKKTAVVSTINGDSNVPFYKELGNQGLKATDVPVVAFSVGEEELRGVDTKPLQVTWPPGTTSCPSRRPPMTLSSRSGATTPRPGALPATRTSRDQ